MLTTTLEMMVSQLGSIGVADDEVNPSLYILSPGTSLSFSCGSLSFPCLLLSEPPLRHTKFRRFNTTNAMADIQASKELSRSDTFKHSDIDRVPQLILNNWVSTFMIVLQRRRQCVVQNSVNFLGSDTDTGWNNSSRRATLKVLSKSSIFKLVYVTTESKIVGWNRAALQQITDLRETAELQVTLPVIFSLKLIVTVLNKQQVNVMIKAKGIIKARFLHNEADRFQHMEFHLDTAALYKSMKDKSSALVELADTIADMQNHVAPDAQKIEPMVPNPDVHQGGAKRHRVCHTSSLARSGIEVDSEAYPLLSRSARCA